MRMGRYVGRWRRVVALLVLVFGLGLRVPAQTAEHFAADPVFFDYPAGWAVTRDGSNPQLTGFVVARPELNAQMSLYFAPNEITAPASSVPTLLEAARTSLVLPLVEQLIPPLEAAGAAGRLRARRNFILPAAARGGQAGSGGAARASAGGGVERGPWWVALKAIS